MTDTTPITRGDLLRLVERLRDRPMSSYGPLVRAIEELCAEPALPKRTEAEAYEQGWLDAMTEADKLSPSPCRIVDQVLVGKSPQEVVDEWRSAIRKRVEERRRG
jgi:hypothetical protein